jgi:hypothetical protein
MARGARDPPPPPPPPRGAAAAATRGSSTPSAVRWRWSCVPSRAWCA